MLGPSQLPHNPSYPGFMWWELLMLWRQLYLVGFALLVRPGTVEQLVISFLIALSMMLLFAVAAPFKDDGDDYFAQVCNTPTRPPPTPVARNASEPPRCGRRVVSRSPQYSSSCS